MSKVMYNHPEYMNRKVCELATANNKLKEELDILRGKRITRVLQEVRELLEENELDWDDEDENGNQCPFHSELEPQGCLFCLLEDVHMKRNKEPSNKETS